MNMAPRFQFFIAVLMTTVMTATSFPLGTAYAGMISTEEVISSSDEAEVNPVDQGPSSARDRVKAILARSEVRAEMVELGVDPAEADARVAALTDDELSKLAGQLEQLPAGEGFGVGSALIVLFVVFGVAVMLDALGMMNIFPFVCGPGQCGTQQANLFPQQTAFPEPAAGPVADDYLYQEERAPAYRSNRYREDPYARRRQPRYQTETYFEPSPQAPTRNYYEERFGTRRQIR